MNKFVLTMNMPSRKGNEVHQVIAGHPSESMLDFKQILDGNEFILVEEFYYNAENKNSLFSRGEIIINCRYIGKVKMI